MTSDVAIPPAQGDYSLAKYAEPTSFRGFLGRNAFGIAGIVDGLAWFRELMDLLVVAPQAPRMGECAPANLTFEGLLVRVPV